MAQRQRPLLVGYAKGGCGPDAGQDDGFPELGELLEL